MVDGRSIQARLDILYDLFVTWCRMNHKTSSLEGFSLSKFKMTKFQAWVSKFLWNGSQGMGVVAAWDMQLRLQQFPKSIGKGFDTVLLCEWLDDLLGEPGGAQRVEA